MLLPSLIVVLILLAPLAYVAFRKFSVVEQEISFAVPQKGVAAVKVLIRDDHLQQVRLVFADGCVCEVVPKAAGLPRSTRVEHLPRPSRRRGRAATDRGSRIPDTPSRFEADLSSGRAS